MTRPRKDGLPRDIIEKPMFYKTKEKVMIAGTFKDNNKLGSTKSKFSQISLLVLFNEDRCLNKCGKLYLVMTSNVFGDFLFA